MRRIDRPISRLARSLSSKSTASGPCAPGIHVSKTPGDVSLKRGAAQRAHAANWATAPTRSLTTSHQPLPSHTVTLPPVHAFHTSAAASARLDTSTIDFAVLPSASQLDPPDDADPFARLRVPLLPDNFSPDRSLFEGHSPEALDAPLPAPEIVVIAAHPENVIPAALTEVEGIGVDGVELKFAHEDFEGDRIPETGMLTDLWRGLLDDVLGGPGNVKAAA